ncbi:MAG: adenylate/guanylate cyclase domain-containing protein [Desulfococcaceae bacterium]
MQKKTYSVQTAITLLLILLIVPLSVLIIVTNYLRSADSMRSLTHSLMENISVQTVDKAIDYLQPARRGLDLSRGLATAEILRSNNPEEIEKYFRQLLIHHPEFVMLNYGQEDGSFMMVKRMPDQTFSTKWIRIKGDLAYTEWVHENAVWQNTYKNMEEPASQAYDPRQRPWYMEAKKRGDAIWTNAYIFFSDRKPGISCASPIFSPADSSMLGVVGIDIGIEEISKFIGNLHIGKNGKAFIINRKGELIAYPAKKDVDLFQLLEEKEVDGQKKIDLRHILSSSDTALTLSYKTLMGSKVTVSSKCEIFRLEEIRFAMNGSTFMGTYLPFPSDSDWPWIVGVIIPEDDFMAAIRRNNMISFAISLTALITALAVGVILARKITKPLAEISQEAMYIRNLDLASREKTVSRISEIMNLSVSMDGMKKGLVSFEKYVPSELVRLLLKSGMEARLGGAKQEITVLFSDIAGFTKISEQFDPEILVAALGEYLDEMSRIIHAQKGTVDKFIGDAIMAFWGAPLPVEHHALHACRGALLCQRRLRDLRKEWAKKGMPVFKTRFGINTGDVIVGNMGCEKRMDYTVIGDHVNLASRLEGTNKVYGTGIIISENTARQVRNEMALRILDYVAVVGKKESTAIYELICEKNELPHEAERFVAMYAEALELYRNRKWEEACKVLSDARRIYAVDRPAKVLYERCTEYIREAPPEDWNGVFVLKSK